MNRNVFLLHTFIFKEIVHPKLSVDVNGYHQLFGYQHSSKYLLWAEQKKETCTG